jgi:hypothetical protein
LKKKKKRSKVFSFTKTRRSEEARQVSHVSIGIVYNPRFWLASDWSLVRIATRNARKHSSGHVLRALAAVLIGIVRGLSFIASSVVFQARQLLRSYVAANARC